MEEKEYREGFERLIRALELIAHELVVLNRNLKPKDYPATTAISVTQ